MRRRIFRFFALVFLVCTGLTERISATEPGAQVNEILYTKGNEGIGRAGNGQDSSKSNYRPARTAVWEHDNSKDVLLVLDPNGLHCWEEVSIDNFTNSTLLTFLHTLDDALTVGRSSGSPLPMRLPVGYQGEADVATFTELVEEAWRSQASTITLPSQLLVAFQMTLLCTLHPDTSPPSCLDSARLKVTDVEAFWTAVERTVAAGRPVAGNAPLPMENTMSNTVIILPRIVTRLYPVNEAPEDHIYRDFAEWDADFVIQMLEEFLRVSSAKTFPSLDEYSILPDKVQLQSMYEAYYNANPSSRTPPIPTVNLHLKHPPQRESELCLGAEVTDSERDAAKTALLDAIFDLEKAIAPEHSVRFMVNVNGSDWMGRYIIKREYSEGASNIFDLTLPQLGPISTSSDDMQLHQGHYSADVVPSAPMRSHADPPHAGIRECSSDQTHTSQQLGFVLSFAKAAASKLAHLSSFLFHSAPSSISAKPGTCQAEAEVQPLGGQSSNFGPTIHPGIGPDLAGHNTADSISCSTGERPPKNGSWAYPGLQLPAELKNLLAETADKLLHHSCGEGWLVQPRIANMSHLEYRVYLLGGASAMNKVENNAVVYTPCSIHADGLHSTNFTVPEGMICSDVLPLPGDTRAEVVSTSWRSFKMWAAPEVYNMILKAAHDGAEAMVSSPSGHLMRMVSNVMVRIDVVLGAHWDHTGQVLLLPMINEMDWFNSAGMMTSFWKGSLLVGSANEGQDAPSESNVEGQKIPFGSDNWQGGSREATVITEVQSSAGFKIAQALYKEILDV